MPTARRSCAAWRWCRSASATRSARSATTGPATTTQTPQELALLQALADTTAVAIANVYAYEELELARLDTLNRLALASEFRDDHTHAHTQRVALTAELIAEQIGLAPHDCAQLRQAAPLHDIGKIGIADAILLKEGRLTARRGPPRPRDRRDLRAARPQPAAGLSGRIRKYVDD
jgi:HD-GYP domain-containing protein (c-di-GMP phosphodiesterase class II)